MRKLYEMIYTIRNPKLIFLFVALFFGFEYFILGPFSYVRIGDNLDSFVERPFLAWRTLLSHGGYSFWQPYFSGGMDRLANMASFNELGDLLYLFPAWIASAMVILGTVFVGGFYIFRLSNEILHFGKKASIVAGVLFTSFFIIQDLKPFILGIGVLPLVLYYLEKFFSNENFSVYKRIIFFAILGVIYSFFSSLVLTLPFTAFVIILWFFIIRKQKSFFFYFLLVFFFLPVIILKSQEAWSLFINTPLSRRGAEVVHFTAALSQYISRLLEMLKVNIIALSVIFLGLPVIKKKKLGITLMILVLCFIFLPPLIPPLSATSLGSLLGPFRNFEFRRLYLVSPFFSSLATAYVLNYFEDIRKNVYFEDNNRKYSFKMIDILVFLVLFLAICSNIFVKINHATMWLKVGSYHANTYSPDLAALATQEKEALPFRVASMSPKASKSLFSFIPNFHGLETVDAAPDVTTRRIDTFFELMSGDKVKGGLYFFWDIDRQISQKMMADFVPSQVIHMPLISLFNTRFIISDNLINQVGLKLVETPSVSTWQPWGEMGEFDKIKLKLEENFRGKKLLIYENKNYFPRFFLVRNIRTFDTETDLLNALAISDEKILRENVFLLDEDAEKISNLSGSGGKVEVLKYSNDEIKLRFELDGPAVLVIGNNFTPFWEVQVNGNKRELIPAYHALSAVFLDEDNGEVELVYNPPYRIKNLKLF